MERLPIELLSKIIDYLTPRELTNLQLVSKQFESIARDNSLWRSRCYESSFTYEHGYFPDVKVPRSTTVVYRDATTDTSTPDHPSHHQPVLPTAAQWDPSGEEENVNWYAEYVSRYAPISFQWLEEPRHSAGEDCEDDGECQAAAFGGREVKGMGQFKDRRYGGSDKVIGPLDDGSVCIWDLNRSVNNGGYASKGRVAGVTKAGLLLADRSQTLLSSPDRNSPQDAHVDFVGVGECVSVDSVRQRAYFAVGPNLNEVDLNTMQVISSRKYPWVIFALSQEVADYDAPLTVATTLSLNLYDSRCPALSHPAGNPVLPLGSHSSSPGDPRIRAHLPPDGNDFASLFQPGPLSVTHTPLPNLNSILLAGRFPSVLLYDRRFFPRLQGAAHSGARLCGSTVVPASPQRHLPGGHDWTGYHTAVACGEYNGRGSLELYALSAMTTSDDSQNAAAPTLERDSVFQNRQSASRSKLLSVASHGTRLVYSDADGNVNWVERDARTPVRTWNINTKSHRRRPRGSDSGPRDETSEALAQRAIHGDGGDVIRKILPTGEELENDEVLLWTGDRIGRLRFYPRSDQDVDEDYPPEEDPATVRSRARHRGVNAEYARRERNYMAAMERSLRGHVDQLGWMPNLGLGD